jgi:hypothetical protein
MRSSVNKAHFPTGAVDALLEGTGSWPGIMCQSHRGGALSPKPAGQGSNFGGFLFHALFVNKDKKRKGRSG